MTDKRDPVTGTTKPETETGAEDTQVLQSRRGFLIGLGKWSRVVIAAAVAGGGTLLVDKPAQAGWLNRRGGGRGWVNGRGGGGSWANRRGGGRGGSWINRR